MKRNALDICCAAGGASKGLEQAGFHVVGMDLEWFANYPGEMQGEVDLRYLDPKWIRRNFDFVWASPPCQKHTRLKTAPGAKQHIDLIPDARKLLRKTGLPWTIENVVGAPLKRPLQLDGSMFDLHVRVGKTRYTLLRERLFEFDEQWQRSFWSPHKHALITRHTPGDPVVGVYGGHARDRGAKTGGRGTRDFPGYSQREIAALAMDIDWMTLNEMSQAIPPAYAKWIGRLALKYIDGAA